MNQSEYDRYQRLKAERKRLQDEIKFNNDMLFDVEVNCDHEWPNGASAWKQEFATARTCLVCHVYIPTKVTSTCSLSS